MQSLEHYYDYYAAAEYGIRKFKFHICSLLLLICCSYLSDFIVVHSVGLCRVLTLNCTCFDGTYLEMITTCIFVCVYSIRLVWNKWKKHINNNIECGNRIWFNLQMNSIGLSKYHRYEVDRNTSCGWMHRAKEKWKYGSSMCLAFWLVALINTRFFSFLFNSNHRRPNWFCLLFVLNLWKDSHHITIITMKRTIEMLFDSIIAKHEVFIFSLKTDDIMIEWFPWRRTKSGKTGRGRKSWIFFSLIGRSCGT